jgi:uncharacterized surface protein with fasciclin (FAS1) repeats
MARLGFGIVLAIGCLCFLTTPPDLPAQKKMKGKGVQNIQIALKLNPTVFKTWTRILESSDVLKVYQGPEPVVTMFAPTEDAFAKVRAEDLKDFLNNKPKLIRFITYHTIEGEIWELDDLEKKGKVLNTLLQPLTLKKEGEKTKINGVTFGLTDMTATNGIIHGIEGFLMPIPAAK